MTKKRRGGYQWSDVSQSDSSLGGYVEKNPSVRMETKTAWQDSVANSDAAGSLMNSISTPQTQVQLPLPPIYVSGKHASHQEKMIYRQSKTHPVAFRLILNPGYTDDEVNQCQGRYSCMLCDRPIPHRMYFIPKKQLVTKEFVCDPVPYCRVECCFRGMLDTPNNFDLKTVFVMMYGKKIRAAPPRRTLKVKGGFTLDQFHEFIDSLHTMEEEPQHIRAFICPLYLSSSIMEGFQPLTEAQRLMDELHIERKTVMGPSKTRDNEALNIVTLDTKYIDQTPVADSYPLEKSSFEAGRPQTHSSLMERKEEKE